MFLKIKVRTTENKTLIKKLTTNKRIRGIKFFGNGDVEFSKDLIGNLINSYLKKEKIKYKWFVLLEFIK